MELPKKVRWIREKNVMELSWIENLPVEISAYRMRIDCRCASCVDEVTGKRILDISKVPTGVGLEHVEPAGRYALKIRFSDGHDSGLFTWEHLFDLSSSPPM